MIQLIDKRIDVDAVRASVSSPAFGAILVFEGVGRDNFGGKGVLQLSYEAYQPMAEGEMSAIAKEAADRWPGVVVSIVHRTGDVAIGEPSVVIAVGSPHRSEGYEASRYALEQLKARVPIWKKEHYADGTAWKANAAG
jgi:MoaE-MoaD fusion protein